MNTPLVHDDAIFGIPGWKVYDSKKGIVIVLQQRASFASFLHMDTHNPQAGSVAPGIPIGPRCILFSQGCLKAGAGSYMQGTS